MVVLIRVVMEILYTQRSLRSKPVWRQVSSDLHCVPGEDSVTKAIANEMIRILLAMGLKVGSELLQIIARYGCVRYRQILLANKGGWMGVGKSWKDHGLYKVV